MKNKVKHILLTMMLAVLVAQPAIAGSLNQDDMAFAFGDTSAASSDFGEIALLSNQEMKDTEGERFGAAFRVLQNSGRYVYNKGRYVWRNTNVDGYNGSRIFQLRWRQRPVYRLDYKGNPSPSKLHMHFGNMRDHRPWYAPWKKY